MWASPEKPHGVVEPVKPVVAEVIQQLADQPDVHPKLVPSKDW